ncbi:SMI1/KNR4 family protein [Deinococcus altitudinis]|uniref:SMI1/KNR4 family protein n=1 Tax=Deinococcus altitudinis TaxID=468914 RepID=UPI003891A738
MTQRIMAPAVFWKTFETWLSDNGGETLLSLLRPGAEKSEIEAVENSFGFSLPDDFRALYSIHNGAFFWPDQENLLSLEEALAETQMRQKAMANSTEPSGPVTETDGNGVPQTWWDNHWFCFTRDGGGNGLAVQCSGDGSASPVVYFDHESGTPSSDASLPHYLANLMSELKSGWYVVRDDTLCTRDQLDEDDEDYAEDQDEWLEEQE